MKHDQNPTGPILDLVTSEEIHRALLRVAIARQGVSDPDLFLESNHLESQVMYRDVRMPDGSTAMMASVAIIKVTPKNVQAPISSDAQGKGK